MKCCLILLSMLVAVVSFKAAGSRFAAHTSGACVRHSSGGAPPSLVSLRLAPQQSPSEATGLRPVNMDLRAFLLGEARDAPVPQPAADIADEAKRSLGFSQLSEKLNGRLAIVGLFMGLLNEELTGRSFIQQLQFGLDIIEIPNYLIASVVVLLTLINHTYTGSTYTGSTVRTD